MRIYECTLVVYVVAPSEMHAKWAANNATPGADEWEVETVDHVNEIRPEVWLDSIPWCDDKHVPEWTVRKWLEAEG